MAISLERLWHRSRLLEFSHSLRRLVEAGPRGRYPNADEHEILLRYARTTLGPELYRKAYGEALPDDGLGRPA